MKFELGNKVLVIMGSYNGKRGRIKKVDINGVLVSIYGSGDILFARIELRKIEEN